MRVFDRFVVWRLDGEAVEKACQLIADSVPSRWSLDGVVAVGRGGIVPGNRIADLLELPAYVISVRHNSTDGIRSAMLRHVRVGPEIENIPMRQRILVVDDICGTGRTLCALKDRLTINRSIRFVKTAVLCLNVGSEHQPNIWIWRVRDWVVFPWESSTRNVSALPNATKAFVMP